MVTKKEYSVGVGLVIVCLLLVPFSIASNQSDEIVQIEEAYIEIPDAIAQDTVSTLVEQLADAYNITYEEALSIINGDNASLLLDDIDTTDDFQIVGEDDVETNNIKGAAVIASIPNCVSKSIILS